MKNLKALMESRAAVHQKMEAVVASAKTETRALTADEQKEFDTLETQASDLSATISRIKALEASEQEAAGEDAGAGDGAGEGAGDEGTRSVETRAVEARETADFASFIRSAVKGETDVRDLDFGNNGAIVPKTIANKIIATVYDISPIVDKANRYNTKGTFAVPTYGADYSNEITMAYQDEFTELVSEAGKFGSVNLASYLAGALALVSKSLVNNSDIDVVAKVVQLMAEAIARFLEHEALVGTTGKATGLEDLTNGYTTNSTTVITSDDLLRLKNKVKAAFRKGSMYIFHQDVITEIEALKDGNDRYIFNGQAEGPFAGTVFGYPVFASDNLPATVAADTRLGYFGNPVALGIRLAPEIEVEVLRERFADQHAIGVTGWVDFDIKTENHQAMAWLKSKVS
jgi:HK97 family phage major capsid protein